MVFWFFWVFFKFLRDDLCSMNFGAFQRFILEIVLCSLYNVSQNGIGDGSRFVFKAIVGIILGLKTIYDFLSEILYFTEPLCIKDQDYLRNQFDP